MIASPASVLNNAPGRWDSAGTIAAISRTGLTPIFGEHAGSMSRVDESSRQTLHVSPGKLPEVEITLKFEQGMQLTALGTDPHMVQAEASIQGTFTSSLTPDPATHAAGAFWSFSWTADSADPGSSVFSFQSNPSLGLNDAVIDQEFAGLVSDVDGVHTLTSDVTVTATLFPTLARGSNKLTFSYNGAMRYRAGVNAVPEPSSWVLLGLGGLGASRLVRRRPGRSPAGS